MGPMTLTLAILLIMVVAVVSASFGYLASARSRRRPSRSFVAGFLCGMVAFGIVRRRSGLSRAARAWVSTTPHLWRAVSPWSRPL